MTSGEVIYQSRALHQLEDGEVFLAPNTREPYVLLLGHQRALELLGREPPSLPIKRVERNGIGYSIDGAKHHILGSSVEVESTGSRIDDADVEKHLSQILDGYLRYFR